MTTETVQHKTYGTVTFFEHDAFIGYWVRKGVIWEEYLTKIFSKYARPGTTVVDAGAFIGLHSLFLAKECKCTVYAFEPQPIVFGLLNQNVSQNSLAEVIFPTCTMLSNKAGIAKMAVPKSYNTWTNPGGLGIVDDTFSNPDLRVISVPKTTLDSFSLENVSLMKVDVEGHEMEVLAGSYDLIWSNRPVLVVELLGGCDRNEHAPEILRRIKHIEDSFHYTLVETVSHDYVFVPTEKMVTTPSECPPSGTLPTQRAPL